MAQPGTHTRTGSPASLPANSVGMTVASRAANASGSRKNAVTPISRSRNSRDDLLRVLPQAGDVGRKAAELHHLHPPLDPAQEGLLLVAVELVADLIAQDGADLAARRFGALFLGVPWQGLDQLAGRHEAADIADQLVGHRLDRQHEIDQSGGDGAGGHAAMSWGAVIAALRDRQPAMLLDRLDAERSVAAAAGQHDADGVVASVLGQAGEEQVDRVLRALRTRERLQPEPPALDDQGVIGWDDVDVVGLDRGLVPRLHHRHGGEAAEDLVQHAGPMRGEVRHHHEGHAAFGRHRAEQALERLDATGGGADADDEQAVGFCHRDRFSHRPETTWIM